MNHSKIIRGVFALPFLLVGSVALAQGAQEPSGSSPSGTSQTESQRLRQQDALSGSQAGRTGTGSQTQQGTQGQQQPGMQQGQQPSMQQGQQPSMQQGQQPGMQQGQQQPGMQQPSGAQARQQPQQQQQQAGAAGTSFQEVDRDGNGEISRNELRQSTQAVVSKWDYNQDGKVSQLEVTHGIFTGVDRNGDKAVDEQEFQTAQEQWIPENAQQRTFAEWDPNSDGKLEYFEFAEGLVSSEVARKFDQNRDSRVSERELQNGLLSALDRDGNGRIDAQEWPMS